MTSIEPENIESAIIESANTAHTFLAPAKLNLFLHITQGPSADGPYRGYHCLETLFQLLDFGDAITFRQINTAEIHVQCPSLTLPTADNLVTRAARALQAHTGCTRGVNITIDKQLPLGGGLGGGSSDAATTLLALNAIWQLNLDIDALATLGQSLGADVPVFVRGRTAYATGIGEQLTPCDQPPLWYVLVAPAINVSTATLFQHPQLPRNTPARPQERQARFALNAALWRTTRNDFQALARQLFPEIGVILDRLALLSISRLTGTGATCFAAFETKTAAQRALDQLQTWPELSRCWIRMAQGVNRSPVHEMLGINV